MESVAEYITTKPKAKGMSAEFHKSYQQSEKNKIRWKQFTYVIKKPN